MECPPVIFYLAAEVVLGVIDAVLGRLRVRVVTLYGEVLRLRRRVARLIRD